MCRTARTPRIPQAQQPQSAAGTLARGCSAAWPWWVLANVPRDSPALQTPYKSSPYVYMGRVNLWASPTSTRSLLDTGPSMQPKRSVLSQKQDPSSCKGASHVGWNTAGGSASLDAKPGSRVGLLSEASHVRATGCARNLGAPAAVSISALPGSRPRFQSTPAHTRASEDDHALATQPRPTALLACAV
jgi:hypothetical protein